MAGFHLCVYQIDNVHYNKILLVCPHCPRYLVTVTVHLPFRNCCDLKRDVIERFRCRNVMEPDISRCILSTTYIVYEDRVTGAMRCQMRLDVYTHFFCQRPASVFSTYLLTLSRYVFVSNWSKYTMRSR